MHKLIAPFMFLALLGLSACDSSPKDSDTLIVGMSADYPPFDTLQDGKIAGLDADLAEALGKKLNKKIIIKDIIFNSLIPSLQTGKINLIISGMTITPERAKNVDFSELYYHNTLALIHKKDQSFKGLQALEGRKIGAQLGSTMDLHIKSAQKEGLKLTFIPMDGNPALVEELKMGRLDAVLVEEVQAIEFCKMNPSLAFTNIGVAAEGYAIALKQGSPLTASINQALKALQQDGTLEALKKKWLSQ